MSKVFWDILADTAGPGQLERLSPTFKQKLYALSEELALILSISQSCGEVRNPDKALFGSGLPPWKSLSHLPGMQSLN